MAVTGWPRALHWSDFRTLGERPPGERENAQIQAEIQNPTEVQVATESDGTKRLSRFTVNVGIVRSGTWVVASEQSPALLRHEQVHWDMAGLVAHEEHRALEALREATATALQEAAQRVLARMQQKVDGLQRKYDRETDHGRLREQQARWNRLVQECIENGNRALPEP